MNSAHTAALEVMLNIEQIKAESRATALRTHHSRQLIKESLGQARLQLTGSINHLK